MNYNKVKLRKWLKDSLKKRLMVDLDSMYVSDSFILLKIDGTLKAELEKMYIYKNADYINGAPQEKYVAIDVFIKNFKADRKYKYTGISYQSGEDELSILKHDGDYTFIKRKFLDLLDTGTLNISTFKAANNVSLVHISCMDETVAYMLPVIAPDFRYSIEIK